MRLYLNDILSHNGKTVSKTLHFFSFFLLSLITKNISNINGNLKEKLKYIYYLLFPSLTPMFLFQNLTS